MDTANFVSLVNFERRKAKGSWYQWGGVVNGKSVVLKAYRTWVQVLRVEGLSSTGPMDCTVKAFKEFLAESV